MQTFPTQTQRADAERKGGRSRKGRLERDQRRSIRRQIAANTNQQALEKRR
jgi:hypothetical protein